uniref:Uncharacterized protein n=1 Tax=Populus alba TaxID=43335 RepID=A0A4U5PMY8_POPAL|nr:hypothetical protein D5086_0000205990 [Populus alba]
MYLKPTEVEKVVFWRVGIFTKAIIRKGGKDPLIWCGRRRSQEERVWNSKYSSLVRAHKIWTEVETEHLSNETSPPEVCQTLPFTWDENDRHCSLPTTPNPPALPISPTIPTPAAQHLTPAPPPTKQQQHQLQHTTHNNYLKPNPTKKSTQAGILFLLFLHLPLPKVSTQWRFPLSNSPPSTNPDPKPRAESRVRLYTTVGSSHAPQRPARTPQPGLELQLTNGSETEQLSALYLLERSLVTRPTVRPVLLALCLAEANRHVAVEAGRGRWWKWRWSSTELRRRGHLAALELTCTVGRWGGRAPEPRTGGAGNGDNDGKMGWEGERVCDKCSPVIYGVAELRQMVSKLFMRRQRRWRVQWRLALQGDCTARGRRRCPALEGSSRNMDG